MRTFIAFVGGVSAGLIFGFLADSAIVSLVVSAFVTFLILESISA